MKTKNKKLTFGIIGYGRFGRMWAKYLTKHGKVFVYDSKIQVSKSRNIISTSLKGVVSADVVFLAVPISEIESVCRTINPLLLPRTLVVDVCSVKMFPILAMKKNLPKNQPFLATHPLFGPDSERKNHGLKGFKIVVSGSRGQSILARHLVNIFKKMELKVIFSSPEKHDLEMARSQALVHFIGRALTALKLRPQYISTPDYQSLLRINQMVDNDTWELFFDMQNKNSFAENMRRRFMRELGTLHNRILMRKLDLTELRASTEELDRSIIELLAERLKIVGKIGKLKKQGKLKVFNGAREKRLKALHRKYSQENKLDRELADKIFDIIIKHSRKIQI